MTFADNTQLHCIDLDGRPGSTSNRGVYVLSSDTVFIWNLNTQDFFRGFEAYAATNVRLEISRATFTVPIPGSAGLSVVNNSSGIVVFDAYIDGATTGLSLSNVNVVSFSCSTIQNTNVGLAYLQVSNLQFFRNNLLNNQTGVSGDAPADLTRGGVGNFWGHSEACEPCFFVYGGTQTPYDGTPGITDSECSYCSFCNSDFGHPTITCPPDLPLIADAQCSSRVPPATASDECDSHPEVVPSLSVLTGAGPQNIAYTATDASGNIWIQSCTLRVVDVTPPTMDTCPAGALVGLDACMADVPVAAATDNCDPSPSVSVDPSVAAGPGMEPVIYTARDDSANESKCGTSFDVTCACAQPPAGMVSWWTWDGNTEDYRDCNSGTLTGTTFVGGSDAQVGQALHLESTDSARIPASGNLNVGTSQAGFAIEGWIKPAAITFDRPIFEWHDGTNSIGVHFWILNGYYYANIRDTSGMSHTLTSTSPPIANAYQHVALTYDKPAMRARIFLNGVDVSPATPNLFSITPQTSYDLYFGVRPNSLYPHFVGEMDEVSLYNAPLSAAQIMQIHDAGRIGKCRDACVPPPSGLVNWWPGEASPGGTTPDLRGSKHGTLVNGAVAGSAGAYVGSGLVFDGVDDAVSTELFIDYANGVTLDAWIKVNPPPDPDIGMVMAGGGGDSNGMGMGIFIESGGTLSVSGSNGSGQANFIYNSGIPINDGCFHHVAATWNGIGQGDPQGPSEVRLYLDGVVVGEGPANTAIGLDSAPLKIGGLPTAPGRTLSGVIDEVEIYDRALSNSEILAIYDARHEGKCRSYGCVDFDGDGYGSPGNAVCPNGAQADCDDAGAAVHPGAGELCNDADDDCDNMVDEGVTTTFYRDADGDGYGDATLSASACAAPAGYVASGTDCCDSDPATYPGVSEVNDGRDNSCPGDAGHGIVDEITGAAVFMLPQGGPQFCWPGQAQATLYQVARSEEPSFNCCTPPFPVDTSETCLQDLATPPAGRTFFYLVRAFAPFAGSWGVDSAGNERAGVCAPCFGFTHMGATNHVLGQPGRPPSP